MAILAIANNLDPRIQLTLSPDFILDSFAYLLRIPRSRLSIELGNADVHDAIWVYIDGSEDPYYFEHAFYLDQPPPSHPYIYTFSVIDTEVPSSQTRASLSVDIIHPHQITLNSEEYQRQRQAQSEDD